MVHTKIEPQCLTINKAHILDLYLMEQLPHITSRTFIAVAREGKTCRAVIKFLIEAHLWSGYKRSVLENRENI